MTDPRNYLFNSDFPIDQVIGLWSGQGLVAGNNNLTITIPHGLPFTPLLGGVWSLTPDFAVCNEFMFDGYTADGKICSVYSDPTNITIGGFDQSASSATPFVVYYKLFALAPESDASDLPPTASQGDNFVFNTDYNYMKLILSDYASVSGGQQNITHNLGYYPVVDVWAVLNNGNTYKISGMYTSTDDYGWAVNLTTTQLQLRNNGGQIVGFHYRIYGDEA